MIGTPDLPLVTSVLYQFRSQFYISNVTLILQVGTRDEMSHGLKQRTLCNLKSNTPLVMTVIVLKDALFILIGHVESYVCYGTIYIYIYILLDIRLVANNHKTQ